MNNGVFQVVVVNCCGSPQCSAAGAEETVEEAEACGRLV